MSLRTRIRTMHRTNSRLYDGTRLGGGIDYRATRPMPDGNLCERGEVAGTVRHSIRATGLEWTPRWRLLRGRDRSLDGRERAGAIGFQSRHSFQKSARVRMAWRLKDIRFAA